MITEKTRKQIIKLSVAPILERLSERAREEVRENFCIPHCGKIPEGGFCPGAKAVYKGFLALLCKTYSGHN